MKTITIRGTVCPLKIKSRHMSAIKDMMGMVEQRDRDGHVIKVQKTVVDAIIDSFEDPVGSIVPLLWGVGQNLTPPISQDEAFDVYDELVDKGYQGSKWGELATDICTESGFFDEAVAKGLKEIRTAALTSLLKINGSTTAPMQTNIQPIDLMKSKPSTRKR